RFALRMRRREIANAKDWATRQGWSFEAEPPSAPPGQANPLLVELGPFPFFPKAQGHLWDLARGEKAGGFVSLFEYCDDLFDGQRRLVACWRVPGLAVPAFTLQPTLWGIPSGWTSNFFNGVDARAAPVADPAFSKQYILCAADPAAIQRA